MLVTADLIILVAISAYLQHCLRRARRRPDENYETIVRNVFLSQFIVTGTVTAIAYALSRFTGDGFAPLGLIGLTSFSLNLITGIIIGTSGVMHARRAAE